MAVTDPVKGDPFESFLFGLEIDGVTNAYFTEVSGIGSESEVIDHKVVGEKGKQVVRKVPGRLKWGDITLKRGLTANLDFWKWFKDIRNGKIDSNRRAGTIKMFNQAGEVVALWEFEKAWVSKISGPSIKSASGEIGVEDMVIVHEYIQRKKP